MRAAADCCWVDTFAMAPISTCRLSRFLTSAIASLDSFTKPARLSPDRKRLEIRVRPRVGSKAICSGCHRPAAGYDHLAERSFEFIPVWGLDRKSTRLNSSHLGIS